MAYVDGFVLSVPKDRVDAYRKAAATGAELWKANGALSVVECLGDDVPYGEVTSFPRAVMAGDDEVVVFSWITYPSKEVRDAANAAVLADPRMREAMGGVPVDGRRMIFGGFTPLLEA